MNKHIIQVVCEAASKCISEFSKQMLLLIHGKQLVMTYGKTITIVSYYFKNKYMLPNIISAGRRKPTWSKGNVHALQKSFRGIDAGLDTFRGC